MAYTEFYARAADGSNLNAGSTNAAAAAHTYASGSWVASTGVFTVASGDPAAEGVAVGNWASVYPDGSTVGVFVGRVTASDATTITVSLVAKSGTAPTDGTNTRTLKIGGGWKGPNAAENFPFNFAQNTMTNVAGDFFRINFIGTFNITAAITHANVGPGRFQGATATAGDGGRATIDGGTTGASYVLLTLSGANNDLECIIFSNNGATGAQNGLVLSGTESFVRRCVTSNVRGSGLFFSAGGMTVTEHESFGCNQNNSAALAGISAGGNAGFLKRCISHDNAGSNSAGFLIASGCSVENCIAESNGGIGFNVTSTLSLVVGGCDVYNNASDGMRLSATTAACIYIENCNFVLNGGWGINGSGVGTRNGVIANCGFGAGTQANTSGTITGASALMEDGNVTYAANAVPWVDPANGDFRVTLAAAKAAGRGSFTQTAASYAGTISYPDIGAAQHIDAGGAAVFNPLAQTIITVL